MKDLTKLVKEIQDKKDAALKEVDSSTNIMDKAVALGKCSAYLDILIDLCYYKIQEQDKVFTITQEMSN